MCFNLFRVSLVSCALSAQFTWCFLKTRRTCVRDIDRFIYCQICLKMHSCQTLELKLIIFQCKNTIIYSLRISTAGLIFSVSRVCQILTNGEHNSIAQIVMAIHDNVVKLVDHARQVCDLSSIQYLVINNKSSFCKRVQVCTL